MCLCMCSLSIQHRGTRVGVLSYYLLDVTGGVMRIAEIGGLPVSSMFLMRVGVYVSLGVCICTHAHTQHLWSTRM